MNTQAKVLIAGMKTIRVVARASAAFIKGAAVGMFGVSVAIIYAADASTPFSEVIKAFHFPTVVQLVGIIGLGNAVFSLLIMAPDPIIQSATERFKAKQ